VPRDRYIAWKSPRGGSSRLTKGGDQVALRIQRRGEGGNDKVISEERRESLKEFKSLEKQNTRDPSPFLSGCEGAIIIS